MIDNKTTNLLLPLPDSSNTLSQDVVRLISALNSIDSILAAKANSTDVSSAISTAIANLVNSSPTTLDTLKELADALGNDPNFATTITTALGNKLSLSGGTMTGIIAFAAAQTFAASKVSGLATVATTGSYSDLSDKPAGLATYSYDSRNTLRTLTPTNGDVVVVDGLGVFRFFTGSTEPDDDESCFATSTGRWLLQAAHWDLVDSWQLPELEAIYDAITLLESRVTPTILFATGVNTVTSVLTQSAASFSVSIPGAAVGDAVIVTPDAAHSVLAFIVGRVTAPGTVTVYFCNPSTSTASTFASTYTIAVIKNQ